MQGFVMWAAPSRGVRAFMLYLALSFKIALEAGLELQALGASAFRPWNLI